MMFLVITQNDYKPGKELDLNTLMKNTIRSYETTAFDSRRALYIQAIFDNAYMNNENDYDVSKIYSETMKDIFAKLKYNYEDSDEGFYLPRKAIDLFVSVDDSDITSAFEDIFYYNGEYTTQTAFMIDFGNNYKFKNVVAECAANGNTARLTY